MRLSPPFDANLKCEMVAEQCPVQRSALTASTHSELYKNDANLRNALSMRFLGEPCLYFPYRLCNL